MAGMGEVRDLRFEGMDIPELRKWIGEIKDGRGPESMETAARALERAVHVVADLDDTLRRELGKLGIDWEGYGGATAQEATRRQRVVLRDSQEPLEASTRSVQAQGQGFSTAKNGLPNADELRQQESENFLEWSGGAFGYESDYDQEAKRIDGQKKAAQAALGSYRDTTVRQADSFQPLPEMPAPASVTSQGATGGGGLGAVPAGGAGGGGGSAGVLPGAGAVVGGGNSSVPDDPVEGDRGDGSDGGSVPGTKDPGGHTGTGGGGDGDTGDAGESGTRDERTNDADSGEGGLGVGGTLGIAAGGLAVAGGGALAAGRLLGGRKGMPETPARGPAAVGKGGSSGIGGGPGDTAAGRTAGGSSTSRPGSGSLMGPAATRGRARSGPGDDEHENQYSVEETHFDDNRLAAPPVLGGSPVPEDEQAEPDGEKQD